jgi:hypothetical protein
VTTAAFPPSGNRLAGFVASAATLAVAVALVVWWSHEPAPTIGVEGRRTVRISGPELAAVPFTPGDALAVRIAEVRPITGGYEYDLRFMGFGPGEHDMAAALRRPDGSPPASSESLRVRLDPLIPDDYSGELYETAASSINLHTHYSRWMTAAWVLWAALLVPLVWYGRRRRRAAVRIAPPPSVVERLRALLLEAAREKLSPERQADIEQLLLAFWSTRLKLSDVSLGEAIEQLRRHPQAGSQWSKVERWLHSPDYASNGAVARELLAEFEGAAR